MTTPNFLSLDFNEIEARKNEADSQIKPWQLGLKKGDCFYYYSNSQCVVVWGEVIEDQTDVLMFGYRLCRCFHAGALEGVEGVVHISVVNKVVPRPIFDLAAREGWPHDEVTFTRFAALLGKDRALN